MSDAVRSRAPLALLAAVVNASVFVALMGPAVADTSPSPQPAEAAAAVEAPAEAEAAPVEAPLGAKVPAAQAALADTSADNSPTLEPVTLEPVIINEATLTPADVTPVEALEEEEDALIEEMLPSSHFGGY